ncbi:GNAT family N-acetyltransferase [Gayadomonas joobiniege]|uniref:GNAT family N-acetyltransferase n=1 Tax=Gayadomonas joobiniege TaxID=1234606 RepID=UPI00035CD60A|nr:GNAT family N-acetyltransferase [Gayadomonas joobiniege]
MWIREACRKDIPALKLIRQQHSDNPLPTSKAIPDICYQNYLTRYGKGWVACVDHKITGYVISSRKESSIWALFIDKKFQRQGQGSLLLTTAADWLYINGADKIYLATAINSAAEHFYQQQGWQRGDLLNNGQVTYSKIRHCFKNTG